MSTGWRRRDFAVPSAAKLPPACNRARAFYSFTEVSTGVTEIGIFMRSMGQSYFGGCPLLPMTEPVRGAVLAIWLLSKTLLTFSYSQ